MSNIYCTTDQLATFYDNRVTGQLSNDSASRTAKLASQQLLLDTAASELDSWLTGRYPIPLPTVPLVCTRWVAVKAMSMMYARRTDKPKEIVADEKWAEDWIQKVVERRITIPLSAPQVEPELHHDRPRHREGWWPDDWWGF